MAAVHIPVLPRSRKELIKRFIDDRRTSIVREIRSSVKESSKGIEVDRGGDKDDFIQNIAL